MRRIIEVRPCYTLEYLNMEMDRLIKFLDKNNITALIERPLHRVILGNKIIIFFTSDMKNKGKLRGLRDYIYRSEFIDHEKEDYKSFIIENLDKKGRNMSELKANRTLVTEETFLGLERILTRISELADECSKSTFIKGEFRRLDSAMNLILRTLQQIQADSRNTKLQVEYAKAMNQEKLSNIEVALYQLDKKLEETRV